MIYYFGVKETEAHDQELDIIEADSVEQAKKIFAENHPEDVKNLDYINEDGSIINLL